MLQAPCVASEKVIVIDDKFVASQVFQSKLFFKA